MREKNPERADDSVVVVVFGMGVVALLAVVESVGEALVAGSGASAVDVVSASSFIPPFSLLDGRVDAGIDGSPSFFSSLLIMMLLASELDAEASLSMAHYLLCSLTNFLASFFTNGGTRGSRIGLSHSHS